MSLVMYTGDLKPDLVVTCTADDPVDLTDATSVRILGKHDDTILFDRTPSLAVVGDSTVATMLWEPGDTADIGRILIEVEATWPGNKKQTFRADGGVDVRRDFDAEALEAAEPPPLETVVSDASINAVLVEPGTATRATITAFVDTAVAAAVAAPLVTKRTLGDITLVNTGAGFADLDDTGTPTARNLDIIFPNVEAGQVVELEPNLVSSNGVGFAFLTFASIVAGAPVNLIHGTGGGVGGWFLAASAFATASGAYPYTLQAGDIENGNARFRLQYKSAGSKTIYANSATTYTLTVVGRGPKG